MTPVVSAIVAQTSYPLVGILVPGAILLMSFILTWVLYRHFSRKG